MLGVEQTELFFSKLIYQLFVLSTPIITITPSFFTLPPKNNVPEVDNAHESEPAYNISDVTEHVSIVRYGSIRILAEVVVVTYIQVARVQ